MKSTVLNGAAVEQFWEMIDERVTNEWTDLHASQRHASDMEIDAYCTRKAHVFDQKHRPPAYLRTQILHSEFCAIRYSCILQSLLVSERFVVSLNRELLASCVKLDALD